MLNEVKLIGHVGAKIDTGTAQEANYAKFSVATSKSFKTANGEKKEVTEWHSVIAWRNTADVCGKYLKKGSLVYIEGELKTRQWIDKNDVTRFTTDVIANKVLLLDKREKESAKEITQNFENDLPF